MLGSCINRIGGVSDYLLTWTGYMSDQEGPLPGSVASIARWGGAPAQGLLTVVEPTS